MKVNRITLEYETNLWKRGVQNVVGVDEAGRGPLAGPVVAAAVIFPEKLEILPEINDSKQLTARKRESLFDPIFAQAQTVGIGIIEADEIDRINILRATQKAMRQAIGRLKLKPGHLLIDGRPLPDKIYPQTAIVGGDRLCYSIAAASIVAKVYRDRLMQKYDAVFPGYGFAKHKGYGTRAHLAAIQKLRPCPIHRCTFRGVSEHVVDLTTAENTRWLGKYGEDLAAHFLFRQGYAIIARNFHLGSYGELDIIANHDGVLCFVEVKTQRRKIFGPPESWVDEKKMRQLGLLADGYLAQNPHPDAECRFDVIAVNLEKDGPRIEHLVDAFRL